MGLGATFAGRLLALLLPLLALHATAQIVEQGITVIPEEKPGGIKLSVGASTTLAFSGFNTALSVEAQHGRHAFYAGPKLSLVDSYLPTKGPFGAVAGYKFYILPDYKCAGRFGFFFDVDYQGQLYRAFRRDGSRSGQYNQLHELQIGYGLECRLGTRWRVNNVFGFGRYMEIYNNATSGQQYTQSGYNRLVRLQLLYTIN